MSIKPVLPTCYDKVTRFVNKTNCVFYPTKKEQQKLLFCIKAYIEAYALTSE